MKRFIAATACLAAIAFAGIAFAQIQIQPNAGQQGILIGLRPAAQASAEQRPQIERFQALRGAGQINIARLQTQALRSSRVGQMVQFQVSPSATISARALSVEASEGVTVWRGEVPSQSQEPPGTATIVMTNAGVTGTIHSLDGHTYRLRPLAGGDTAIIEMNYDTMLPDHPPGSAGGGQAQLQTPNLRATVPSAPIAPRAGQLQRGTLQGPQVAAPAQSADVRGLSEADVSARLAGNASLLQLATRTSNVSLVERYRVRPDIWRLLLPPTIDILVAYTPSAQAAAGDINGLINLAIAETNGSFTNSNVWAQVRLVGTVPVSYNESGRTYDTILDHLAGNGDGFMDAVHTQRDALHADLVVLIVNQTDWCGMAREIGANAAQAFVAVHWDCATGYYSFGHEIAHLAGARHDEPTDTTDSPFAFGHGFRHQAAAPNGWRTIMGYKCSSHLCDPRLQYWSSPLSTWNGIPMGSSTDADNRRVWNERAATLAAFR